MAGELVQADICKQGADPVAEFTVFLRSVFGTERLHDLEWQHHVALYRQPGKHSRVLEGHADAQRLGANFSPPNDDRAPGRLQQAGGKPHDR